MIEMPTVRMYASVSSGSKEEYNRKQLSLPFIHFLLKSKPLVNKWLINR